MTAGTLALRIAGNPKIAPPYAGRPSGQAWNLLRLSAQQGIRSWSGDSVPPAP
jgi:hypothetical protein